MDLNHRGPTFFIIGAARAGTTYLAGLLDQHPEVYMTRPKEPHYFAHRWSLGEEWYRQCFSGSERYAHRGDASTTYSAIGVFPDCIERIRTAIVSPRFIYLVRDPLPRLQSLWKTLSRDSHSKDQSFADAVLDDRFFIESTLYWKQFSAYSDAFGEDSIKVIFFEDFVRKPRCALNDCFRFLGLKQYVPVNLDGTDRNSGEKMRKPTEFLKLIKHRAPGMNAAYARLNPMSQRLVRQLLKRHIEPPEYTDELRRFVLESVQSDSNKLLSHFGKPSAYWSLQ